MCIAIVLPANTHISDATIRKCATRNADGCGLAYVSASGKGAKNAVVIRKYATCTEEAVNKIIAAYEKARESAVPGTAMLMHFRARTAGDIVKQNAHPFRTPHGAMVHNGHLFTPTPGSPLYEKGKSDSLIFSERYGEAFSEEFLQLCKVDVEKAIYTSNKMAFLWKSGQVTVLNESGWVRDNGILFSNAGYR